MSREVVDSAPSLSILLDKLLTSELFAGEAATGSDGQTAETPSAAGERRASELRATIKELESRQAGLATVATGLRKLAAEVKEASDADEMMAMARAEKLVPGDLVATLDSLAERGGAVLSSAIFDRAKKIETETRDIEAAIKRLRSKLRNETSRGGTARIKPIPLATAKKEWYEKFRWFFTTEGKLAIGGRDAQSNTMLIRRHMENGDRVFHADLFGSPFFLLKGGGGQTEAETRQVAKATVAFSSAWKTGLGAADAYWVEPDQIAAAGPAGEYLAHGSFAIKGKKNFVTKNAVEIAVGIDESGRVVSGPEESIMRVAKAHVALVPSREKSSDTAKKVIHELSPYSNPQVRLGVDDVLRMLPAGGGKIIRRKINRKGE